MSNSSLKKIVYLFGGPSVEHDVSCMAAEGTLTAFAPEFLIKPIFISKENKWAAAESYYPAAEAWEIAQKLMTENGITFTIVLQRLQEDDPYVIFSGLHGAFGEDGTLQLLLDSHGLPYTGSDAAASALAIDKPKVLQLLQNEEVPVPEFLEVIRDESGHDWEAFADFVGYPVVVLPADSGSSVDVTLAESRDTLAATIADMHKKYERVMLSQYIAGPEFSCGVLVTGPTDLTCLPPTEIQLINEHRFWDYDAKYVAGECEEVTPANRPPELIQKIQETAKKVHLLVGADGYSRTDMILNDQGDLVVLEINTQPGMTPQSVLPAEAKAAGMSFTELLTTICTNVDHSEKDYLTVEVDPED